MSDTAISISDLGYFYRPDVWVLRHCEARVARGGVFAILGPNGRGKTTLLHLLIGASKPREGSLAVRGRIAFVPQLFEASFDYTALDMALMGRARKIGLFSQPSRADVEATLSALDRFGMADFAERPFGELSGGQRQLVIFARALVAEADILVLDEPTSALDLENQALVLERIAALAREDGLTVVMTTHQPHHALAVADDALLMRGEGDYLAGKARDILTEESLRSLYRAPLKRLAFEHEGVEVETIAPILTPTRRANIRSQTATKAEGAA
ncbi:MULTISPECIES: ABC transporter ATP-binding protein [Methylosinus]|uniref:ABC transporter ATP-binding protein n=1 Tax=Methylosinus trichosporium (strain ATCC 35070 / NCIMB 11131 / UNIQEM 75 / OB3b) TaxID=595536 RepID=A0A2D2D7S6_METT3|nr:MULTISPECIES: ABC transporter ATP-binding protein [Methylosinus]ATQ71004.1 ABC transporter ATP-binding protein [Methylosinus trichosporium OB3b]OBS50671.1 ferrichrome ABC transporter [Methylosinus sp. 3S-1]